jgi:hypothetical protein
MSDLVTTLVFKLSRAVMANFCRNADSFQELQFQQPGQFSKAVTYKPLTISSWEMNHQKAERVTYQVGI